MAFTQALIAILATTVAGQGAPISLCTENSCSNCPNSITSAGTGYPSCVIYNRNTVLGESASQYQDIDGGNKNIYYDIATADAGCRYIIRSPASTDEVNCGCPIYGGQGGTCFVGGGTKSIFMVQFCCGTGDCTSAGVEKRSDGSFSSMVLRDSENNIIVPHSVGDASGDKMDVFMEDLGLNSSSVTMSQSSSGIPDFKVGYAAEETAKVKRDCSSYTANGAPYTKTGSASYQVSGYICDSTSAVTITNEMSVAHTTTFSASVSDPFGIVSTSVGFKTETEASQSYSYMFTPMSGQCGHMSFTPFFTCTGGTITGCDAGDQNGEVCTAKRVSGQQVDGAYVFVQTQ